MDTVVDTSADRAGRTTDVAESAAAEPIRSPNQAPTSFGSFKPTGHVMLGLPDLDSREALQADLLAAGWQSAQVQPFDATETVEQMQALIDNASPLAGFGSEIVMMRRYLHEARRGTRWLLVQAEEEDALQRLAELARRHGARLAVSYRSLVVEDLI